MPYPLFTSTTETIKLPLAGKGFSIVGSDIKRTVAGSEYRRSARIDNGIFTATASIRSVKLEFPADKAVTYQKALHKLADTNIGLKAPPGHKPTAAEIEEGLSKNNYGAKDYVNSGSWLAAHRKIKAARADFNAALALDTQNALALAYRGVTYALADDGVHANKDFAAAIAIDPDNWMALYDRGLLAYKRGNSTGAVTAFTQAIHAHPKSELAFQSRALAYWRAGQEDKALADIDAALKLKPGAVYLYWRRTLILKQQGKTADALHQAHLVVTASDGSVSGYLMAGAIYAALDKRSKSDAAFDHVAALTSTAQGYFLMARQRPWTDIAGKRSDIESALELDPESTKAHVMLANVQMAAGQFDDAIASLTSVISKKPPSVLLRTLRAIAYEKSGKSALASKDLSKASAAATTSADLDNMCWYLATAGIKLKNALANCNAALAKTPGNAPTLDSRGFVLMRLGRYKAAIAAYDAALKANQWLATSLYGRGICELRSDKLQAGHADIRAAMALSYQVADQFSHYGIRP